MGLKKVRTTPNLANKQTWQSREEVARRARISVWSVKHLEEKDILHADVSTGVARFSPLEVEALVEEYRGCRRVISKGTFAARCFHFFDLGKTLSETVQLLQCDPRKAREMYEEWCVSLEEGVAIKNRERRMKEQRELEREAEQRRTRIRIAEIGVERQDAAATAQLAKNLGRLAPAIGEPTPPTEMPTDEEDRDL